MGADVYLNWLSFGGNDYEVSFGNCLCERKERVKRCVKQADGGLDSVLIMATLVWEATLCSRSIGAEEWRIIMAMCWNEISL